MVAKSEPGTAVPAAPLIGRRGAFVDAALVAAIAAIVYFLTVSERVTLDSFLPLASSFVEGRLHIAEPMPWLELVPRDGGGFYSPFPPMPGIVLIPFVALFGPGFDQGIATALFGAANVALVLLLLRGIGTNRRIAMWLTAAFAFGTVHWWAAGTGTVWLHAQIVAVLFALLAMNLAVRVRMPLLAGLLLGCAAASRLPVGLTLPIYLALYLGAARFDRLVRPSPSQWRAAAVFVAGVAVPAALVAVYNLARFGSPFEFGYGLIPGVLDEPWYANGLLSIDYVPRHIHLIFMRGPDYVDQAPWFRPNWTGMSLLLTTPILLWLVKARSGWLVAAAWVAIGLGMVPDLLHGAPGFAQFGYRFILDVMPVMLLLLGLVFRDRISIPARAAILIGIVVNAYGVWAVTVIGFVSY
ncbi:MAG: hypothetical protein ABIO99_08985 [Candidatus Limnocylindria bacterium]